MSLISKKNFSIIAVFGMLCIVAFCVINFSFIFAYNTMNGSTHLSDITSKSLRVNGSFLFENVKIEGELNVNGSLKGSNLIADAVNVNGSVDIKKAIIQACKNNGNFLGDAITVNGTFKINGILTATNSCFETIEAKGRELSLTKCSTKSIVVKKDEHPQVLRLDETKVLGSVTFESGDGEIILKGNAEIKGDVIGARIQKQ